MHGGRREGSGRKRKPGRREPSGRLAKPKVPCACGGLRCGRARWCATCRAANRKTLAPKACVICQQAFVPARSAQIACGTACGKAYTRQRVFLERSSPEKTRLRRRRSCAARHARLGNKAHEAGRWRRICARDGYVCWLCRELIDPAFLGPHPLGPSVDHVVPIAAGGTDDDSNLRPAHYGCNSRRGAARFGAGEAA